MGHPIFHVVLLAFLIGLVTSFVTVDPSHCDSDWSVMVADKCQENDLVPLKDSCYSRWFCECENGSYVPTICPLGKLYNRYTKVCDPWPPANCTVTTTTLGTTTQSTTTAKPKEPCSKEEEGHKKAASECHQYLLCSKGFWGDPQSCSTGYYFNSKNLDCELNTACWYCNCL